MPGLTFPSHAWQHSWRRTIYKEIAMSMRRFSVMVEYERKNGSTGKCPGWVLATSHDKAFNQVERTIPGERGINPDEIVAIHTIDRWRGD